MIFCNGLLSTLSTTNSSEPVIKVVYVNSTIALLGGITGRIDVRSADRTFTHQGSWTPIGAADGLWMYRDEPFSFDTLSQARGATDIELISPDRLAVLTPAGAEVVEVPAFGASKMIPDTACYTRIATMSGSLLVGGGRDPIAASMSKVGDSSRLIDESFSSEVVMGQIGEPISNPDHPAIVALGYNDQGGCLVQLLFPTSRKISRRVGLGPEGAVTATFGESCLAVLFRSGSYHLRLALYDIPEMSCRFARVWQVPSSSYSKFYQNSFPFFSEDGTAVHLVLPDGRISTVQAKTGLVVNEESLSRAPVCSFRVLERAQMAIATFANGEVGLYDYHGRRSDNLNRDIEARTSLIPADSPLDTMEVVRWTAPELRS